MARGRRSKSENDFLNKLVSDCITFRLKESDSLEYIKSEFGKAISKRAYWDRKRKVLKHKSDNGWISWYSRVGFVQSFRRHIDDLEAIHNDSMNRFYQLTHEKSLPRNENIILKTKHDIRENLAMLVEFECSTPLVEETKKKLDEDYKVPQT